MSASIEITNAGIVVPETSEVKQTFQGVFVDAFGTNLNLDDSTSQGVLIDDLTAIQQDNNSKTLYLMNQFNPETAEGAFQDALGAIYFMQRKPATSSVVNCECVGVPGTVLNGVDSGNPAMAQSVNGDRFQCLIGGTIPAGGTITLQFAAVEKGEIPVSANTVNRIATGVVGWDTVNNSTAGTVGTPEESRADFETRRKQSLAINATGSLSSVYAHVFACDGVTHVRVDENPTNNTVTKNGISLGPHSVYVCQNGATDTDELAKAFYESLSAGCDTNGTNTCSYVDPVTGVANTYNYYTPTNQNIYIKLKLGQSIPSETQDEIKETLLANFNGQNNDGYSKIEIGESIYATRFYSVVLGMNLQYVILENIKVSTDGSTWTDSLSFNMNILPVLDIESSSPSYVQFEV